MQSDVQFHQIGKQKTKSQDHICLILKCDTGKILFTATNKTYERGQRDHFCLQQPLL